MTTVNGSETHFQPYHLTEDKLISEALNSEDPTIRRLAELLKKYKNLWLRNG